MADDASKPFLARWSQRKLAAARETAAPPEPPAVAPIAPAVGGSALPATGAHAATTPPELPPVESLTFDSDYTAFLSPKVDPGVRQQALRKLFRDPRFNVMDGLDVYIDDYTKFEPITPDILAQLQHAKFLFDPPKTRVNAQGYVEDVPPEEPAVADVAAENALDASAVPEPAAKLASPDDASLPPPPIPTAVADQTR